MRKIPQDHLQHTHGKQSLNFNKIQLSDKESALELDGFSTSTTSTFIYLKCTEEPRYNEDLGIMENTLLYQVSHCIRVKKKKKNKELGPTK